MGRAVRRAEPCEGGATGRRGGAWRESRDVLLERLALQRRETSFAAR